MAKPISAADMAKPTPSANVCTEGNRQQKKLLLKGEAKPAPTRGNRNVFLPKAKALFR